MKTAARVLLAMLLSLTATALVAAGPPLAAENATRQEQPMTSIPATSTPASPAVAQPATTNSAQFIDVTRADGAFVKEPIEAAQPNDAAVGQRNSARMPAIMAAASDHCLIYFPAGAYPFAGAGAGWQGSIETTNRYQTIAGAGSGATLILQQSVDAASTIRVRHDGCAVRDLYVGSADRSPEFHPEWEDAPHQTAIHLDGPVSDWKKWPVDPAVQNVNINSQGNSITLNGYSRPFRVGLKVTGSWLNVYVHTAWITDTFTAIDVYEGPVMAGPAKFIDVNFYATHDRNRSKAWTTFFRSVGRFMEQVELIHCTFIGAQFIHMDGQPLPGDSVGPVYDMVIDHNYINVVDLNGYEPATPPEAERSGIFLRLPPMQRSDGGANYARDIRFTNNSCTGRAPRDGAFFYVEGMCREITFSGNDISCAGQDKCIYIRPTDRLRDWGASAPSEVAIRDVKISDNYFRSWISPITIGGDKGDPGRAGQEEKSIPRRGADDDPYRVARVIIANNQSMQLGRTDATGLTLCYLNRCDQAVIEGNTFVETPGNGFVVRDSADVAITGNTLRAWTGEDGKTINGGTGIALYGCDTAAVTGNTASLFGHGVRADSSRNVTLAANAVRGGQRAIECRDTTGLTVNGNTVAGAATGLTLAGVREAAISGNRLQAARPLESDTPSTATDVVFTGNVGLP